MNEFILVRTNGGRHRHLGKRHVSVQSTIRIDVEPAA